MKTMLEYAHGYLRGGWSVFPLHGKEPLTAHGHLDASTNPAQIDAWWTRWPAANIGAPVPAGVVVIDVDPRNGGSMDDLPDLPPTMTAWSGRMDGGRHLYFRRPAGELTSTRLPAGIDLKKNGYMVMPPSIHPATGQPYTWQIPTDMPPAFMPTGLRDLLTPQKRRLRLVPGAGEVTADGLVRVVAEATEGGQGKSGRNDALFWAACRAAEEGTLERIADQLRAAALSTGLDAREVDRTIASAARNGGAA